MLISQIPVNRGCWVIFSANIQPTDHTSTGVEYFKPSNHQTQHEFDSQLQSISPSIFLIPHSDHHRIAGDQAAFWGCGFFGAQDTLHDDSGRHYFKDCYIQGSIDFIFGNARSLYESCQLSSIANPVALGAKVIDGVVTAHGRASKDENSGFAFVNCSVGGTGRIWLGPFSMESTCAEVQELI